MSVHVSFKSHFPKFGIALTSADVDVSLYHRCHQRDLYKILGCVVARPDKVNV